MIHDEATKGALGLALIGAIVGLGQLLASNETLTKRLVFGRALSSGALGMAAAAVLSFMPEIPFAAQMGLAATIASLGTSGLERVVQRVVGGN
jgi:hypothetical protein